MTTRKTEERNTQWDSNSGKAKRGRPRRDYSAEIGQVYNGNEIVAILNSTRTRVGVEVMAKCAYCPELYRTRLRRLRSGETKSCGCLKELNFLNYVDDQVGRLSPERIAGCWTSRYMGLSRRATAAKYHLKRGVVDEAQRRYQAKLDELIEDEIDQQLYRMTSKPVDGKFAATAAAAAAFGLPIEAAQYLLTVARRQIKTGEFAGEYAKWKAAAIASQAAEVVAEVAATSGWSSRRIRPWRNELTCIEFRRTRKGELLGKYARLYVRCKGVDRSLLDRAQREQVDAFLDLADNTISSRYDRHLAFIRKMKSGSSHSPSFVSTESRVAA